MSSSLVRRWIEWAQKRVLEWMEQKMHFTTKNINTVSEYIAQKSMMKHVTAHARTHMLHCSFCSRGVGLSERKLHQNWNILSILAKSPFSVFTSQTWGFLFSHQWTCSQVLGTQSTFMDESSLCAPAAASWPWLDFEVKGDLISLAILGKNWEVWLDVCQSKFPHCVKYELRKIDN